MGIFILNSMVKVNKEASDNKDQLAVDLMSALRGNMVSKKKMVKGF